ncbi:ribonuclease III [Pectinatus cerevisiiphilus]|uniref:Ribonuclease 3 n=1 Tax=Pectinatus cerevisiiphilus TaxID=86956 RepID=A0A4R3K9U2_9FIRM|nr:ribonuclease III [Pectinatus cerevisiiphilus]TCS79675.1 ribonuclease-3 [Pectinatus cerevisiiphilus]
MSISKERKENLLLLSSCLGVVFKDLALLDTALTHTSYANEAKNGIIHNERLEFLGDAVLELACSTYLFNRFPQMPEGEMTKARASVVCETTLADLSAQLGVGKYLLLGKGERLTGGSKRPSILADTFEAVIGAIYLDQGWQTANKYILAKLHSALVAVEQGYNLKDYKTILQELVQSQGTCIEYKLINETGPDHAKCFCFAAVVNGERKGSGSGSSKKEAEQHAAFEALKGYGVL